MNVDNYENYNYKKWRRTVSLIYVVLPVLLVILEQARLSVDD